MQIPYIKTTYYGTSNEITQVEFKIKKELSFCCEKFQQMVQSNLMPFTNFQEDTKDKSTAFPGVAILVPNQNQQMAPISITGCPFCLQKLKYTQTAKEDYYLKSKPSKKNAKK